jgi:hypothetical protein
MAALRRHGRMMLVVAVVALVPALAVTALLDAVGTRDGAIVNGLLAPDGPTDPWTTARITLTFQGAELNLAVPVLVVVGWLAAIAVSLELLGGATVRLAVRDAARRAVPLLGVTVLLILLGLAALYLGLATAVIVGNGVTGGAGVALGAGVAFAGLFAPARLALALPAIAVDGIEVSTAMRRA